MQIISSVRILKCLVKYDVIGTFPLANLVEIGQQIQNKKGVYFFIIDCHVDIMYMLSRLQAFRNWNEDRYFQCFKE